MKQFCSQRFQHPGVAEDYTQMKLDEKIFGYVDKSVKTTASDLLSHPKPTELERINRVRVESIYKSVKREPLGRSPERSVVLPSKFTLGCAAALQYRYSCKICFI